MSGERIGITEEVMEKINGYAVGELKSEQVYCFSVLLCDNDVDRVYERFSDEALDRLAVMFRGRTGIFDHDHRSRGQTARIYDTEVRSYPDRKTMDGRAYRALIGFAYMVRTEDNKSLIAEIEGGIKKEVSVGCSVAKRICSVCGADGAKGGCNHIKGRSYGGKLCYVELDEPLDAYEWSFVAVPAQRAAGVTKVYGEREVNAEIERLRAAQESFCEDLRGDIIRLGCFVKNADMVEVDKLDVFALLELKKKLSRLLREEAVTERAAGIAAAEDDESMKAFRV